MLQVATEKHFPNVLAYDQKKSKVQWFILRPSEFKDSCCDQRPTKSLAIWVQKKILLLTLFPTNPTPFQVKIQQQPKHQQHSEAHWSRISSSIFRTTPTSSQRQREIQLRLRRHSEASISQELLPAPADPESLSVFAEPLPAPTSSPPNYSEKSSSVSDDIHKFLNWSKTPCKCSSLIFL